MVTSLEAPGVSDIVVDTLRAESGTGTFAVCEDDFNWIVVLEVAGFVNSTVMVWFVLVVLA